MYNSPTEQPSFSSLPTPKVNSGSALAFIPRPRPVCPPPPHKSQVNLPVGSQHPQSSLIIKPISQRFLTHDEAFLREALACRKDLNLHGSHYLSLRSRYLLHRRLRSTYINDHRSPATMTRVTNFILPKVGLSTPRVMILRPGSRGMVYGRIQHKLGEWVGKLVGLS